jgi:ribosome-associated translation inhibitor RaiA
MSVPVQIEFHQVTHSSALETLIRGKAGKLEHIFPKLMRCHISINREHRYQQQGNSFNVRIRLLVPGDELIVNRDCHEDIRVALRDAFDAARRQLEEYTQKMRREVKHHTSELPSSTTRSGEPK